MRRNLQTSVWENRHLELLAKARQSNQSSAKTEDKRCATWLKGQVEVTLWCILYEIRLENGTDIWKMHYTFFLEDECAHDHASYNCKLSDVHSNSNGVRRWARPIAGKMSGRTTLSNIFPPNFA